MQFETDQGAVGSTVISQISAGRKNRLWLEVDGAEESVAFDQEEPESLWCGRRESATILKRDPAFLSRAGGPSGLAARGPRPGLRATASTPSSPTRMRRSATTSRPTACHSFADGLRTALITDAVLAAAREERWIDVPAQEPLEVAR